MFFDKGVRLIEIRKDQLLQLCDIMGKIALVVAMFMKVEWKPIPHDSNVKITDLTDKAENKKEKQKTS